MCVSVCVCQREHECQFALQSELFRKTWKGDLSHFSVEAKGQLAEVKVGCLLLGSQRPNLNCQSWQQAPLPTEAILPALILFLHTYGYTLAAYAVKCRRLVEHHRYDESLTLQFFICYM